MEIDYFRFVLAILATFRVARLLPLDDGPFFILERVRRFTSEKLYAEKSELGIWHNVYEAVTCPYCQGLYFAFLCVLLLIYPTVYGDIFLLIFALAGAQALLQKWTER